MPRMVSGRANEKRGRATGWSSLRADLRAAVPDASAALVLTLLIFGWLYARVENGTSATTDLMPMLSDAGTYWMYWMCQAFGWSAMLWAWITVMLGLLRATVHPDRMPISRGRLERWHRTTSLTTIGLTFAHAFMLFAQFLSEGRESIGWAARS